MRHLPKERANEARLPTPIGPDDADKFSWLDPKRDIAKNVNATQSEVHIVD
jgi:hypothetical protein